eukprot:TRINITY_DN8963_c0_g1_i1.p1 TRINITY_DN8963_c0_g1~~TRINITY_DN8963_c0_g1_i1.p1  ORF type:complete len:225 (+),score=61.58 TRINITY_DN8963_c0_g1_i1:46-720(+)
MSVLSNLFAPEKKQPSPEEMLKANKKSVSRSKRQMDREVMALERQEKKVEQEIRMLAKQGQTKSARIMAKEIVRIRKQKEQLLKTKVTLGAVQTKSETARANLAMQKAFSSATKTMATVNAMNSPEKLHQTMMNYEKQSQMMDMNEEMLDELLDDSEEEEEAEQLVDAVFEEIGIELNSQLVDAPKTKLAATGGKTAAPASKSKPKMVPEGGDDADLEALLKSL